MSEDRIKTEGEDRSKCESESGRECDGGAGRERARAGVGEGWPRYGVLFLVSTTLRRADDGPPPALGALSTS